MNKVHSSDGTAIAFDRLGDGPPVVLMCGASTDRMANAPLARLLAERFTVFNYDRRGRGDSDDTAPYAVEREVEDIGAVIDVAGGSAFVYGTSSVAALALEAAASGLAVRKRALWEPPFILAESRRPPADLVERYDEMIAAGFLAGQRIGYSPPLYGPSMQCAGYELTGIHLLRTWANIGKRREKGQGCYVPAL